MAGINIDKGRERRAQEEIGFSGAPVDVAGLGGVTFGGGGAQVSPAVSNIQHALQTGGVDALRAAQPGQAAATALGEQQVGSGADLLRAATEFDPLNAAEARFNRLQGILERGRGRTRDSAESRLLAQGRLGGEGGARQLEGLEASFAEQDAQLLDAQFGQAEQARRGGIADALAVGGAGTASNRALTDQGFRFTAGAGDVEQARQSNLLNLLNAGTGIGQAELQAQIAKSTAASNLNRNLIGKGGSGGGLGSALGALGGGVLGSIGGPIGTSIGSRIGGMIGGKATGEE